MFYLNNFNFFHQGKEFDDLDGGAPDIEEEKKLESEDNIDPVMKQYMEMVQQQKDKEKEVRTSKLLILLSRTQHIV